MGREAMRQADLSMQSGFQHHDMLSQQDLLTLLLKKREQLPVSNALNLDTYADVLAPEPFRAMKNAVICLIAIISRMVIQLGVSAEKSFSLSDYFVYTVEEQRSRADLEKLIEDIISSYADLFHTDSVAFHSKKVTKAIQYIQAHIYEPCTVSDIAGYLRTNPRYFSTLFKKEVGVSPLAYIKQKKMEEARHLIADHDLRINAVAEMLGFCSASHFSAEFKRFYGQSPLCYKNTADSDRHERAE